MNTEERIEKLEQELAELRKCVRTQHLIIEDDKGHTRAELSTHGVGPGLDLYDSKGQKTAFLSGDENGAGLVLIGGGRPDVILCSYEDGPSLILADKRGAGRAFLTTDKDGPRLALRDESGKVIWEAPPK